MERSIATDLPEPSASVLRDDGVISRVAAWFEHADPSYIGLFFVTLALGIYAFSDPSRSGFYNHFVWQADAFLHGRFLIEFPVTEGPFQNGYFQDVMAIALASHGPIQIGR